MNRYILMVIMLVAPLCAMAQKERADIRQGNKLYEQGKFKESQASYAKALKINPTSPEASFNIAGALYKQGLWKEASQAYTALAKEGSAETLYNLGNSLVKERQLDAAIENYKSALRINPSDKEAKFNLAYAQKLKQEGQNKDKNKDQNKDQQQKDQNKDQQQNKPDPKQDDKSKQEPQQQPQAKPESRQDAERMLKAIQAAEDKTKEKVDAQKATAPVRRSAKDW